MNTDKELLDWLADNLVLEGFVGVDEDIYDFSVYAGRNRSGYDGNSTKEDTRLGLRQLIIKAMEAKVKRG